MNMIKEADFRKAIKSEPDKAYLFFGDEDYMKSFAVTTARDAIVPDPSFAFFNEIKLDSFSYSPEALTDALMPLPMMADRKLILLSGLRIGLSLPLILLWFCFLIIVNCLVLIQNLTLAVLTSLIWNASCVESRVGWV